MKILVTKVLDKKVIEYAQSLNIDLHCQAFIKVVPATFDIAAFKPGQFDAIIFTSINAVKFFSEKPELSILLKSENIFSLSGKTADELLKHDIQPTLSAINANILAQSIIETRITQTVLHICGDLTLNTLQQKLTKANISYSSLIVYNTLLQSDIVLKESFDAVMFLSPSGVESFLMRNKLSSYTVCCCIGATTADALRAKYADARIIFPREQSAESMLQALAHYFKNGK